MEARLPLRVERSKIVGLVVLAVAPAVVWVALFALAGANQDRAAATFAPVVGTVTRTDGESNRIYANYEYGGAAFASRAFRVSQAGPYDPGESVQLLVNPENPSEAHLRRERFDFLPAPLAGIGLVMDPAALVLIGLALLQVSDYRRKSRVLAASEMEADTGVLAASEMEADTAASFEMARPVPPAEELRSALVSPSFSLEFAGRSWAFGNRSGPPSPEQLRAVAAASGYWPADPNVPLLAQPVLLVQHFRVIDSYLWAVWLPDGTLAGAVQRTEGKLSFIEGGDGEVLATLEAPRRYLRARGAQSLRDGSRVELGVTKERGFFHRELHLAPASSPVAEYRKHGLNHATITDSRGNVLADITCHRVRPLLRWPFPSVLLVRFTPTAGPLRTLVFTNAVMAFKPLQIGNQNGGG
jgi:hypothetical protein